MNAPRPAFLLVDPGPASKAPVVARLDAMDIDLFVAYGPNGAWVCRDRPAARLLRTEPYHSTRLLTDVTAFAAARDLELAGVGTFFEHAVTQTADLAAALGLPGVSPRAARHSSCNKILMRLHGRRAGLPTPRFAVVDRLEALPDAVSRVGLPCVVKPAFGNNSNGVFKITSARAVAEAMAFARHGCTTAREDAFSSLGEAFLIEEYIGGRMISVDGIVQAGRLQVVGVVEIELGPEPWFTQEVNHIPPRLTDQEHAACCATAGAVVEALGFDDCGLHCELRLTAAGPWLIEVACRPPGGQIMPGYERAYGVDLVEAMVNVWLGRPVTLDRRRCRFVIQKGVFSRSDGRLAEARGYDEAHALPGVWTLLEVTRPGEPIGGPPQVPQPIYYYGVEGSSHDEVAARAAAVESAIYWRVQPD